MKPTVKKRAIGLISKKEIQSTFTKDSISALMHIMLFQMVQAVMAAMGNH